MNLKVAKIDAAIDQWAEAIRKKDVEGALAHFAPGQVRFYLAPPLLAEKPLKETLEEWFANFDGKIGYEIRQLQITANDDLAYCHSINHLSGAKRDGEKVDLWFRQTLCLHQSAGKWLITHVHESVPFYMNGSFKAAVDLQP